MKKNTALLLFVFLSQFFSFAQKIDRVEGSPFPASSVPDTLYITSSSMTESEQFAVGSLSGILAKKKPMILQDVYLHVSLAKNSGLKIKYIETYNKNLTGLLRLFNKRVNGYILCTPKSHSSNAAASLAGVLNAVAIPTDVEVNAKNAGLTKLLDVTDKDEAWAFANYKNLFNKNISFYQPIDGRWNKLVDYTAYTGGFRFFDPEVNGALADSVYNFLNPGAMFYGWWVTENGTVGNMSKKSFKIIPSDQAVNLATFTNMPAPIVKQKEAITPFKVVQNVHTVCFVVSDGDNITWPCGAFGDLWTWKNDNQSRINLGWTLSPALAELAPLIYNDMQGGLQTTPEGRNVMIAGPSGLGYYFPSLSPNQPFHCQELNKFMKKADLSIVNVIDDDNAAHIPDEYLKQSNIDALFYYTYGSQYTGMKGKISWYKGKPSIGGRFTLWGNSEDRSSETQNLVCQSLANVLKVQSTNIHSEAGYSLIPVHVWTMNPHDVVNVTSKLGPNVRVVAPDEFVWLVRKNLGNLPMGTGNGLKGEYFEGTNFESPVLTRLDKKVNFDWQDGAPVDSMNTDQFSVRWSGQIQPLYTEEHTFYVQSDDGVKLTINGTVLIDALQADGSSLKSGKISLEAGKKYDILLEYTENSGQANCSMEWESTTLVRQVVPFTQLYASPLSTKGVVTAYADKALKGYSAGLGLGTFTLSQLNELGMADKDISSVRIMEGFKAILYSDDNFKGDSLVLKSSVDSLSLILMSNGLSNWENTARSVRICANGDTTITGAFYLKNKKSTYFMDVTGGLTSTDYNVNIQQYKAMNALNQVFQFVHLGNGVYKIMARHSKMVLTVAKMGFVEGAQIHQWKYHGSASQEFIVVPAGTNAYKLISTYNGMVIGVANSTMETRVQLFNNKNQDEGVWSFVKTVNREGTGKGLKGEYYNGVNFNILKMTRVDPQIYFYWNTGSPGTMIAKDNFSVRWTGAIQPRYTGTYTFYINSDNGRRLWINDQLVIDKWLSDWGTTYTGTINLTGMTKYDIKLEYFEEAGDAEARLEWSSPQETQEYVPQSQLYPDKVSTDLPNTVQELDYYIYPNPVSDRIYIHGLNEPVGMTVFNVQGKKVLEESGKSVLVNSLSPGLYCLKFQVDGLTKTFKFVRK